MDKPQSKKELKCGRYAVLPHPGGGFTVYDNGVRDRGFYVPSPHYLRQQYRALKRGRKARVTESSLRTMISYYAVLSSGIRSVTLGYEALGIKSKHVTPNEKEAAVRAFWPEENIKQYYEGRRNSLPRISDFAEANYRIYHSIARHPQGMKKMIERIYDPAKFPDLYYELHNRHSNNGNGNGIDAGELGKRLFERFCEGKALQRTDLLLSQLARERKLGRRIVAIARDKVLRKTPAILEREKKAVLKRAKKEEVDSSEVIRRLRQISPFINTYTGVIENLTGLSQSDISLSQDARKQYAEITEDLTQFMFLWAFKTGIKLPFTSPAPIYARGFPVNFTYQEGERKGYADLRIGFGEKARNQAVEIKTGAYVSTDLQLEDIVEKYVPGKARWRSGEIMDDILVVIHEDPERSKQIGPDLRKRGIKVVDYPTFHQYLAQVLDKMKHLYSQEIRNLRPRLHNLDYILDLHEEISLRPLVLLRGSNSEQREWALSVLSELIKEGEKTSNGT